MIHLDTNYLIGLLVKGSPPAADVDGWLAAGPSLAASAMAWTEFLNGPVTPGEVSRVEAVLEGRIISREGTKALSMRRLSERLGTSRMAPYHFPVLKPGNLSTR